MAVVRRLLRGQDGQVRLVFVDPKTGQQFLQPPPGQEVIEPKGEYLNLEELGLDPVKRPDKPNDNQNKTTAERVKEETRQSDSQGHEGTGSGFGRSTTNNFGYFNQPAALSLLGLAPGMVGMVGKGINAGINANNVAAVNTGRGILGLDPLGPMDTAKGFIGLDKGIEHGKVADVSIGKNTYSVGLEAMDDQGRTTLTPEEASKRAAVMGVDINEVSRAEDQGKGFLSGIGSAFSGIGKGISNAVDDVGSFISGLFGPSPTANYGYSSGSPDAPSPTGQENGYGVDMAGNTGTGPAGPSFGGGNSNDNGSGSGQGYSGMGGQDSPGEGAGGGPGGPGGAGHGPGAGDADSDSDSDSDK